MTGDPACARSATETVVNDDLSSRRVGVRRPLMIVGGVAVLLVSVALGIKLAPARTDGASMPGVESVDVGFAQDMQVYLSQAVTMAAVAQEHSTDSAIKALAFSIDG